VADAADARALLGRWRLSGEKMRTWCAENGIAWQSLSWWNGRTEVAEATVVRVAEVVLPRNASPCAYRVVLGSGREVVVDNRFEDAVLRRLLAVVDP